MPLGQAPFGSRTPPEGEDPRARGDGYVRVGNRVWIVGVGAMLLLMAATGRYWRGYDRDSHGPTGPNACLTDRSCAAGWLCFTVPKDDPFTTEGVCSQSCEGDLQCPAGFHCQKVAVTKGRQVVPEGARGATAELTGVCRECGEGGCVPQ